jgi:quercetin dioxygenase-like cupin family protein
VSDSAAQRERAAAPGVIVLGPGEGRAIAGSEVTLKATGEQTGGSIGFLEATTPPGAGPPRHIHHGADELFYVLEGHFQFLAGERLVDAPPGTFVFVPRGTVHAAKNVGTEPGRVLAAFVPGGTEGSFEAFARLRSEQGEDADRAARVRAVAEQYESEFVGPPL